MIVPPLQRHSLVWVDPRFNPASCLTVAEHVVAAREWIATGLPLVAARQPRQRNPELFSLGLTLPPPSTRQRVALSVPAEALFRQSGPMALDRVLETGEQRCRELIRQILAVCRSAKVTPHVYGSMMWQTVSGRPYMTESSDLDVLFCCDDSSDIHGLLDALEGFEESNPRLDGEILSASGWAAAWREVAAATKPGGLGTLLVKSDCEARLSSLDDFWGRKEGFHGPCFLSHA